MRAPTIKDIAGFFGRALEGGLCREADVVAWADNLICNTEGPVPKWLFDLSTSADATMATMLANVPGDPDSSTVWGLVFARMLEAKRGGELSEKALVRVLFWWAANNQLPDEFVPAAYQLDDGFDGVIGGWYPVDRFEQDVDRFFGQFLPFRELLRAEALLTPLSNSQSDQAR